MTRFPRLRRRLDDWSSDHERARIRLAERMDGPLGLAEATWLDEHVAGCPSCAAIASGYEDDRLALRAMRDHVPEPPRDLWARTAAGIEAASGSASGQRQRGGSLGRLPLGALSGLTVVAVVVGVSLLSGSISIYPDPGGVHGEDQGSGPQAASPVPGPDSVEPTPFAVGAGDVAWADAGPNGRVQVSTVGVGSVCPVKGEAGCPKVRDTDQRELAISSTPRTIIASPTRKQAIAIAKTDDASDRVFLVALPGPAETPAPSVEPQSPTPAPETASPSPSDGATEPPSASPSVEVTVEPSASPLETPERTLAPDLAIASGIRVVGESAAFSEDGSWFAFTARPADGSGGPDVYGWQVGDASAEPLTDDGASYFASWSGNELIVSRPDDLAADEASPATVLIDPATGVETQAGDLWRPAVDPSGRLAIGWEGTLARADGELSWGPASGTLELRRWSEDGPGDSGPEPSRVVTDVAPNDFDVRWDESGEWVGIWVADSHDPAVGRLTLYRVDTDRERLEVVDGAPVDVAALPGFSIGDGRLAWATPRGAGGEGSRIQIAAWSSSGVGTVESSPGEEPVVIR